MKSKELAYPATFHSEPEGGFSVSFPDFPNAHTQGDTLAEAFEMAADCLQAVLAYALEEKEPIPFPTRLSKGRVAIPVSLELAPKVALQQAMREANLTTVALAKRMKVPEGMVRRMLDPKHQSKPAQYVKALHALGLVAQVHIEEIKIPKIA